MKKKGEKRWEGCYTKVIQFWVFWNQKAVQQGWCVFEMKPGHSIIFKKAIDRIQSDNFKIDWTAGEKLANLRLCVMLLYNYLQNWYEVWNVLLQFKWIKLQWPALPSSTQTTPSHWRQHSTNSIFQRLLVLMKLLFRKKCTLEFTYSFFELLQDKGVNVHYK